MEHTLLEKIKIRLNQFHTEETTDVDGNIEVEIIFDDVDQDYNIQELINEAWKDVKSYRQYPKSYSEEQIEEDLKQYENVVIKLVLYDYNKIGAEFETQDNDNGNIRTYVKRESILANVFPLVTVLF